MAAHQNSRWTILGPAKPGNPSYVWCRCRCGTEKYANKYQVKRGSSLSCGSCGTKRDSARTHGMSKTPEYFVWSEMKKRCNDPDNPRYKTYGGRPENPIKVCARWNGAESFSNFIADMGRRPDADPESDRSELSIERRDNDLGYWCGKPECPECGPLSRESNCYWADGHTQATNKTTTIKITHGGKTQCLRDWERELGFGRGVLWYRMGQGLTFAEAIVMKKHKFIAPRGTRKTKSEEGGAA